MAVLLSAVLLKIPVSTAADKFDSKTARFSLRLKGDLVPYETMSTFVMPGEVVVFETTPLIGGMTEVKVPQGQATQVTEVRVPRGRSIPVQNTQWQWRAPLQKGLYRLKISNSAAKDSIHLNVLVMVPYSEMRNGILNGYRIGDYPALPLNNNPIYKRPRGFVEVTIENEDTHLTPHFKLKQFLCKQGGGYPKYIISNERLLLKLEAILERVNELGHTCKTFYVMSGYRTPYYNKVLENVTYSEHVYGSAVDIYPDNNDDKTIDDLNRDGQISYEDAVFLSGIVDQMDRDPRWKIFVGGLGVYHSTAAHGPFVHVDVRGWAARWKS
ncbi:MAG TPA: D-Ala-D-Ala carboxypeptidase family metallohydrolase [Acidobacteriota bacterium]